MTARPPAYPRTATALRAVAVAVEAAAVAVATAGRIVGRALAAAARMVDRFADVAAAGGLPTPPPAPREVVPA